MDRRTGRLARGACKLLAAVALAAAQLPALAANTVIERDAWLEYLDPLNGLRTSVWSNTVRAEVPPRPASVRFFTDRSFARMALATGVGSSLFLQADASFCNDDPLVREHATVSVHSALTNTTQVVTLTETTANSGVFRTTSPASGETVSARSVSVDRAPTQVPDDTLTATLGGCGQDEVPVQAWLLVDPSGVVFDRTRNSPLAGIWVTLIDVDGTTNGGRPGEPAVVMGLDGETPWTATVQTDSEGRYSFGLVPLGSYRIDLAVPRTYRRSPASDIAQMPAGRRVSVDASFGERFANTATMGTVRIDVPLDPLPSGLSLQLTASRTSVEVAESIEYTMLTRNVGQVDFDDLSVVNTLPPGFAYVPGSTRVDGRAAPDPAGVPGRSLQFTAGAIAVDQRRTVSFRAVVRTAALQGDGIDHATARASAPETATSNAATAAVTVLPGVFTSDTTVLGTVFADCNRNGTKEADEPGVPGVRLLMEDGTSVVTDGQGRYSLYGIRPITHVLKIDRTTLPAGAEPLATSQRHAGDGSSRFVDPRRSEMQRADFALGGCEAGLREAVAARTAASAGGRELRQSLRTDLPLAAPTRADVKALPATGIVGDNAPAASAASAAPATAAATAPAAPAPQGLAILNLADGARLPQRPLSLRVQSRAGAPARLEINGTAVGDDHIGERTVDTEQGTETREYVGLVLPAGASTVALVQYDPFGNARERREVRVTVAGPLATLSLSAVPKAPADGETLVAVTATLADRDGLPVAERHAITLNTTLGDWDVLDVDPVQPGVQTFIDGPTATWQLRAPASAGRAELQATMGPLSATARTDFTAPLRPMVMAGIVEGVINFSKLDRGAIVPASGSDGFEQELQAFAKGGDTSMNGRAAVFLKGKVRGDHLLTLGYDSAKQDQQRLFRDIQPDTFYPVYGDDSVKGFDAQSTGKLYVKLEHGRSALLYGDFTTQTPTPARQLGAYQRSLTGLRQHLENDRVTANVYASYDSTRQAVVELPANGTSGPFALGNGRALANSERVEVIVRDRNQPSRILTTTAKVRFSDYDFEPFSGSLLFHGPIPSVDADLNPVSIRITYEVEQGGDKFLVAGADAQVAVTDRVEVGGAIVRDLNPLQTQTLTSANATWRPGDRTTVVAEAAELRRDVGGSGAQRVEVQHQDPAGLQLRAFAGRSDIGFVNPSSTLGAGRRQAGLKASQPLNERTRLQAEVLSSGDAVNHTRRDGVLAGIEHSFGQGAKVEAGVRYVKDHPLPGMAENDTRSVRVKLGSVVPGLPTVSLYGEAEQDVTDADKRLLAIGGEMRLPNQGRLYARHEIISSLGGPFLLDPTQRRNTTVIGVDGDITHGARMFGEYRGRDAFGDRETEAAMGLRNRWRVAEGVRLDTSFERVSALSGPATNDAVALTGAIEYTASPLWKATARLEARHATAGDTFLSTLGLARKLDADWTALAKNTYATNHLEGGQPARIQERFQIGAAYRDTATNRMNGLGRYEYRRDSGVTAGDLARRVHIVSTHGDWQPMASTTVTGLYAAKWAQETGGTMVLNQRAQMASVRVGRDIADRWDLGVALRLLTDGSFNNRQQGLGVEAGYRVQDQTWVSVGYNATGFRDRDLSEDRSTQRGAYVRLRVKFDESLLSGVPL